jgi:hypothetical protein
MEYTQRQLYAALASYLNRRERVLAEAEGAVTEWKYANQEMQGPIPFGEVIDRGYDRWFPTKRKWFKKEPKGTFYKHGFDDEGKLRIIRFGNGPNFVALIRAGEDVLDEVHFRDEYSKLRRYILRGGRTEAIFSCYAKEYDREQFEYDGERCVRSVSEGFYIDSESKKWVSSSFATTYRYEYDVAGLLAVYRDMGVLGNNVLLYRRAGSDKKTAAKSQRRRPLVAYAIDLPESEEERNQAVYSDAYGLEMTIDDEWPVDTVLLTAPELVGVITGNTGATSMGTVYAGAVELPAEGTFKTLKADGGTWQLLDGQRKEAGQLLHSALKARLHVILRISDPRKLATVLKGVNKSSAAQIVIAVGHGKALKPSQAQADAAVARQSLDKLGLQKSRVIVAAPITDQNVMDYLNQDDIDGVLTMPSGFGTVVPLVHRIALHST